jgi:hypothetical protein
MGILTWCEDSQGRASDWLVVHKNMTEGQECDPDGRAGFVASLDIYMLLGEVGQSRLLSFLAVGPLIDMSSDGQVTPQGVASAPAWVNIFRRFQTPWYEEARLQWSAPATQQWAGGANEVLPYTSGPLEAIAKGTI